MGIEPRHRKRRGVAVREPKSIPIPLPDGDEIPSKPIDLFHTSIHNNDADLPASMWLTLSKNMDCILRRKEVIQPHLPVRLPCYDLVPITSLTLDGSPQKGWATGFGCYPLS